MLQVISPSQSVNSLTDNNASSSLSYPTDVSNVSTDFFSIGDDDGMNYCYRYLYAGFLCCVTNL